MGQVGVAAHRLDSDAPLLVVFESERCGRCRRCAGFLAQVLQRRHNHETFTVRRVDVDQRPDLAARFGVERVPTMVVIEDKRVRARLTEPRGAASIEQALKPWLR